MGETRDSPEASLVCGVGDGSGEAKDPVLDRVKDQDTHPGIVL